MPTVLPGTDLHLRYAEELVRRVDTYFSLGLEFDEGRRLPQDEELINSDPFVFSSFYNVQCMGVSLEELSTLAGYFPLVVQFFPRSFLLLSLEYRYSVSSLFLEWVGHVREATKREDPALTPQDFYLHFSGFVESFRNRETVLRLDHLSNVLKYEQCCLKSARHKATITKRHTSEDDILDVRPLLSRGIIIERFDFDLPVIILDLKTGRFLEQYSAEPSNILFRHVDDQLETAQIDDDTKDFLTLCDGIKTIGDIVLVLMKRQGARTNNREMENICIEAFRELHNEGYLDLRFPDSCQ
jgi:hypothetical protein